MWVQSYFPHYKYCAFGKNTFFHVLIHKMKNIKISHMVVKRVTTHEGQPSDC